MIMNHIRKTAFGYSTQCNIKCEHCVAAEDGYHHIKMELPRARAIIDEMAAANVRAISFTVGEPLIFLNELFEKYEQHPFFGLIKTKGLSNIASFI